MNSATYAIAALVAFLLGSIPTGYILARARGVDIRKVGSGNIGATNVLRHLGKPAGITVLLIDALKGFVACKYPFTMQAPIDEQLLSMLAGVCAILGHNFTPWLKFKGGKGIATSAGVLLALFPAALGLILSVWLIVFFLSKYVSLASIVAAVVLPIAVWALEGTKQKVILATVLSALAIYKHRPNIQRLLKGEEHRFGKKAATQST